jgi:hypothetical protein
VFLLGSPFARQPARTAADCVFSCLFNWCHKHFALCPLSGGGALWLMGSVMLWGRVYRRASQPT